MAMHFGEIIHGELYLNMFGMIALEQMKWLSNQYQHLQIHNFIVMPNHVHALIEIIDTSNVGTGLDLSLPMQKINSISECIGAFKTTTSKKIHLAGNLDFAWQRSFHDVIVPNKFAFHRFQNYINENPKNWGIIKKHKADFQ
jgi:putative transposase